MSQITDEQVERMLDSLMGAVSRCSMHTTHEAAERLRREMHRGLLLHLSTPPVGAETGEPDTEQRLKDFRSNIGQYIVREIDPMTISVNDALWLHQLGLHYLDAKEIIQRQMRDEASAPPRSDKANAYVADYKKSDGTSDYFVMLRCADREMSIHSHRIRGRAEYEAAEFNHVLTGSPKPEFDDFDVDGPASLVSQEAGE